MKKLIITFLLFAVMHGRSQVTVSLQLPPSGLSMKSQLWNMIVNNNSGGAIDVYIHLNLVETGTNRPVMSATTNSIPLPPGNRFIQYSSCAPVQYNVTDPSYQGFAASEFMPVGHFTACYTLYKVLGDGHSQLAEECDVIDVEPVSPPQLVYPANKDSVETGNPAFNWIAPAPSNLFTSISYDLELTEMYPGQTESDAVQQNIPLLIQGGLNATSYPYPAGAAQLEAGKKYAWRILAKNNDAVVGRSDVWWFTVKDPSAGKKSASEQPFAKLKKGDQLSYAILYNDLKFEYVNETEDTIWNMKVYDLSSASRKDMNISMPSANLRTGVNLVRIPSEQLDRFADKHIYLLEIRNSRDELWQLKFEYRRN